jgi:ElaB/YqjD/DUF883 family membrane-anchored ribosome-binding protein
MPVETNYPPTQITGGADSAIGNPGGSIQDAMEASGNRLASAYEALQAHSTEMLEGAEGFIHNRPFQAVIYAASIGAVLGLVAGLILGGERPAASSSWYRRWL